VTRGERNVAWIEATCRIPEGKFVGQPVRLREWQRKILLGVYDADVPVRRALMSFGRKNAKTTLAALLTVLHLCGPEARPNSQLFSTAQSRDQAAILFALAAKIVRMSPDLREYVVVRDTAKQLFCPELGTLYRALSAEASTAYGLSPVFVVHDELGQVRGPRSELYEAMETAAGAQENPLSIIISTQAPTDADLLSVLIDDAKKGADPKTKLFLFTAPEGLDPFSDEAIRAANPAYGDFLNAEEVRDQAESARRMPARESAYRNLILNQRVHMVSPWISQSEWDACQFYLNLEEYAGQPCYGGLDLSGKNDLTALALSFPTAEGCDVFPLFWAPEEGLADRAARDRVPYDQWALSGYLTPTPGRSIDFGWVAMRIRDLLQTVQLKAIAFDRYRIADLLRELTEIGVSTEIVAVGAEPVGRPDLILIPHGQGYKDMSPAVETVETAILNRTARFQKNPVMTMCALNAVCTYDPAGNRKFDKRPGKSIGRIDGIVASAMAMRCTVGLAATGPSIYETRGVLSL